MPQIGWLEIIAIVIIAILVLGPKEFPIALKKIGSYFGKLKNTLSSFQREVNSVSENIDIEKDLINHKKDRTINVGENIVLIFEDSKTIKYQVQEMLRIEKIFNKKEIQEEIDAYNPLIPDGTNLKATMLIMYPDVQVRKEMLFKLHDIENNIWITVGDNKITALADEDLERSTDDKTSAVHFLRFQFGQTEITEFLSGAEVKVGVTHPEYQEIINIEGSVRKSLEQDFKSS